jgi:hypothetical protein
MGIADWIPTIINVGSSLFGGGGSSAPSSSGLDWGSILQGVGQLASRVEMVPGAGALDEDIRKANRFNLIAGLLGGAGQIAGSQIQASEKRGLGQDLAAILGGQGTYTGQPIAPASPALATSQGAVSSGVYPESLVGQAIPQSALTTPVPAAMPQSKSAALFGLINKYPNQASQILELGTKIQDAEGAAVKAEQDRNTKLEAARIKAMQPPSFSEMQAADSYFLSQGILDPQERAAKVQSAFAERGKPLSPIAAPSVTQPDYASILRGAGQAAAEGEPINVRIPSSAMSEEDAINSFREGFQVPKEEQGQPFLAPGTNEPYPKSAELRREQQQRTREEKDREQVRFEREIKTDIQAPFKTVLDTGTESVPNFTKIKDLLKQKTYAATVQAATLVKAALDRSVVQPSEQKVMLESLESIIEKYKRIIQEGITGQKQDLGESARNALLQTAKVAAKVNSDAAKAARAAINEAVIIASKPNQQVDPQSLYENFYAQFESQNAETLLASTNSLNTVLLQELQGVMPKPKQASTPAAPAVRTPMVPPVPTTGTTAPETYQYNGKSYIVRRRF